MVYLRTIKAHTRQVCQVLQKLKKATLYIKLSKCIFDAEKIDFFGFKVGQFGIGMIPSKVNTIATWPVLLTHCEVQVFISFANFYGHFINEFSKASARLTELLQRGTKIKFKGIPFEMTPAALELFKELKCMFICAPMLVYYNPTRCIMLECNASRFAVGAILS